MTELDNSRHDAASPRIIFLHSPAHPHPSHVALADRLEVSAKMPFAPQGGRRLPIALSNAWKLSRQEGWDAVFAEGPCLEGIFLKVLDRRRRKLARLDSQNSSISLSSDRAPVRLLRRLEFRCWDVMVVIGEAGERASRKLVAHDTRVLPWIPPVTMGDSFGHCVSDPSGPAISLLTGGNAHRLRYKGLDRVAELSEHGREEGWGPITVYGVWSEDERGPFEDSLLFAGHRPSSEVLRGASMLVHLSRYDAFPVAIVEAMLAGVPPIVAEAGSAVLVEAVEPRLHVTDLDSALRAVHWLRNLSPGTYHDLAIRMRDEALRHLSSDASGEVIPLLKQALAS